MHSRPRSSRQDFRNAAKDANCKRVSSSLGKENYYPPGSKKYIFPVEICRLLCSFVKHPRRPLMFRWLTMKLSHQFKKNGHLPLNQRRSKSSLQIITGKYETSHTDHRAAHARTAESSRFQLRGFRFAIAKARNPQRIRILQLRRKQRLRKTLETHGTREAKDRQATHRRETRIRS